MENLGNDGYHDSDAYYDSESEDEYRECLKCNRDHPEVDDDQVPCICLSCVVCNELVNDQAVCHADISERFKIYRPGVVVEMKFCCLAPIYGMCFLEALQAQNKPNKDELTCPNCDEKDADAGRWMGGILRMAQMELREYQKLSAEEKTKFKKDIDYQYVAKKEKNGKSSREKRDENKGGKKKKKTNNNKDEKSGKKDDEEDVVRTDESPPGRNWATWVLSHNGPRMKRHPLKRRNKCSFRRFETDDDMM